jgi:hypothetical protein
LAHPAGARYRRPTAPLPAAGVADELVPGLGLGLEALRTAATEMAATLDDVLTQRLGVSLVAPDGALPPGRRPSATSSVGRRPSGRGRSGVPRRPGRFTVPVA